MMQKLKENSCQLNIFFVKNSKSEKMFKKVQKPIKIQKISKSLEKVFEWLVFQVAIATRIIQFIDRHISRNQFILFCTMSEKRPPGICNSTLNLPISLFTNPEPFKNPSAHHWPFLDSKLDLYTFRWSKSIFK